MNLHEQCRPCGRPSTPAIRRMDTDALSFSGLPNGVGHYDILNLVKRLKKDIRITSTLIEHLEYLMSHTRSCDWQAGSRPIVYKTVTSMSLDLGVSARQINTRERDLHKLGLLTWTDSSNFRRSGYRDDAGHIVSACGIDLSPLAGLYDELAELADEVERYKANWTVAKRNLFTKKRRLRSRLDEAGIHGINTQDLWGRLSCLPKVTGKTHLEEIERLTALVESWIEEAEACLSEDSNLSEISAKTSDWSEEKPPTHTRYKQDNIFKEKSSRADELPDAKGTAAKVAADCVDDETGADAPVVDDDGRKNGAKSVQQSKTAPVAESSRAVSGNANSGNAHSGNISLETLLAAASEEFKQIFRQESQGARDPWPAFVEAGWRRSGQIGIHRSAWTSACGGMGRERAATAVLIVDRNRSHPDTPIQSTGGVLRAMTARDEAGELNLMGSLFGILERHRGLRGQQLQ